MFFYHDGVNNGTRLTVPPQDDRNIVKRWSELAAQHKLDLVVCIAAAQRRGLMDAAEAKRNGKDADNLAPGFRISGLGPAHRGGHPGRPAGGVRRLRKAQAASPRSSCT